MGNYASSLTAGDNARIQVGDIHQYNYAEPSEQRLNQKCLENFRCTDPRDDKKRIEDLKGGLLDKSYQWVLQAPEFLQWRDNRDSRILWITGDPGKGKTMLLCGIIDHLEPTTKLGNPGHQKLLSYFFCQETVSGLNSAAAVMNGLIYLLADQHRSLVSYIRDKNPDPNHWNSRVALEDVFSNILADPALKDAYIIIDALDECTTDLEFLSGFIAANTTSHVKWIISSRNRVDIKESIELAADKISLSLELNEESVTQAVDIYIKHQVSQLAARKNCDEDMKREIQEHLSLNAHGTFLWVALVCKELNKCRAWDLLASLKDYPTELVGFYHQMMSRVRGQKLCMRVLAIMATVYRPIAWKELMEYEEIPRGERYILDILNDCGSFLTVKDGIIYFIHQSAKDFLLTKRDSDLFPGGMKREHEAILRKSVKAMAGLKQDIYGLYHPGLHVDEICRMRPDPDPLTSIQYACVYWIDHLLEVDFTAQGEEISKSDQLLGNDGVVYQFLAQKLLFWLEALSYIRKASVGLLGISKLERLSMRLDQNAGSGDSALFHDARRFVHHLRAVIEDYPLQIYAAGLLFSPTQCLIRQLFKKCDIGLVDVEPQVEPEWSPCLQVLDTGASIKSLTFSNTSQELAALDEEGNGVLWNASDGSLQKMRPLSEDPIAWCLSTDCRVMASVSFDGKLSLLDITTKHLKWSRVANLTSESRWQLYIKSMAFSPDGQYLAMAMEQEMVLWHAETGKLHNIIRPSQELAFGSQITFSFDSRLVAVRCYKDETFNSRYLQERHVYVLDVETGGQQYEHMLGDDGFDVIAAEFLRARNREGLVLVSSRGEFMLWDPVLQTDEILTRLPERRDLGGWPSFELSLNLQILLATWENESSYRTLINGVIELFHRNMKDPCVASFSSDRNLIAAARANGEIWIWDMAQTLREAALLPDLPLPEPKSVFSVICSRDGKYLVATFRDGTFQIFDGEMGTVLRRLRSQMGITLCVAVSNNAERLAFTVVTENRYTDVVFWDVEGEESPRSLRSSESDLDFPNLAISSDGRMVAAGNGEGIHIWDAELKTPPRFLKVFRDDCIDEGFPLSFSPTGEWLVATRRGHFAFLQLSTGQVFETSPNLPRFFDSRCLEVSPDENFLVLAVGAPVLGYPDVLVSLDIESQGLKEICPIQGRFRFTGNSTLSTAWGSLELGSSSPTFRGWGVNKDFSWITYNRRKCLWLPPECRPDDWDCLEIVGDLVVIGCSSGRVLRIKFKEAARNLLASCPYQPRLEEIQPLN